MEQDFFKDIAHVEVPWREWTLYMPVFYHDYMLISAQFLAPLDRVRAWLPSQRMHPFRPTPWHAVVNISALGYRETDVGVYNEVSISVPFYLDRPSPLFVGVLRKGPEETKAYIRHLPVTTELARVVGAEFAGYPKFVADITFEEDGDWQRCRLEHDGQHILTLGCRTGETFVAPRYRAHFFNVREDRMLRSEMILSEREMSASRNRADVQLDLGDEHPIARELCDLGIVRAVGCQYAPQVQAVLTPVIESLPV